MAPTAGKGCHATHPMTVALSFTIVADSNSNEVVEKWIHAMILESPAILF